MKTINYLKILIAVLIMLPVIIMAQGVAINSDDSEADPSAMLDVKSTDKGVLVPRMTQTEIEAITTPANGLTVYNLDNCKFYAFRGCSSTWLEIADGFRLIIPGGWICGYPIEDSRDAKQYATVQIGTQCWMAENLNIGTMISSGYDQTNNSTIEKYCYGNDPENCNTYGGLYKWNEMMEYITTPGTQGICPTGWHVPTDTEYTTLTDFLGGLSVAGGKMKEAGTSHWVSPNVGATNSSGFTTLPGGYYSSNLLTNAFLWSSSEYGGTGSAGFRVLHSSSPEVTQGNAGKYYSYSVRCILD